MLILSWQTERCPVPGPRSPTGLPFFAGTLRRLGLYHHAQSSRQSGLHKVNGQGNYTVLTYYWL